MAIGIVSCAGGVSPQPPLRHGASSTQVSTPFSYSVHPRVTRTNLLLHNCPGTDGTCLTPASVQTAYDYSYQQGKFDGSGQTIVIVDAYGSPTITSDLAAFDSKAIANLPPPPSFTIVYPGGKPTVNLGNATQLGWAEETTLDVEWAHAAAPGAKIVLVLANNDQGSTIQNTQQYAVSTYPNSILSLSFGLQESSINNGANNTQLAQAHAIYRQAAANGITVIASAGDLGSSGGFIAPNPQYPASDPYVLGVGGTSLSLASSGRYNSETAWDDGIGCTSPCGATGGAPSTLYDETLLPHQAALLNAAASAPRQVADVAFDASDTAVLVYIGFTASGITPGTYATGGTSIGPPMIAGIIAVANQQRAKLKPAKAGVGWITDAIYAPYVAAQSTSKPPFHDIGAGSNVFYSGITCCSAGPLYDNPTGLGTPDINNLVSLLTGL